MKDVYTVSQVNGYIKNMFVRDMLLNRVSIKGEVSNCKYHTSGHIYFTLKDGTGQLPCVMFAGQRAGLAFRMEEGQSVVASGSISVYERDGRYQLYASQIVLDGLGQLYEQLEKRKAKLQAEGLFDPGHKKPLPLFPKKIGIVTALTGAALQDIRNIAKRRNPYVQLVLCPAQVQGLGAAQTIVRGIQRLDKYGVDIIIVARGGGSIEDLWAFNEESVARAVYGCSTPVISGVGHETDVTVVDYAADLRAPTPSAAAELAVYEAAELFDGMAGYHSGLAKRMLGHINQAKKEMEGRRLHLSYLSPRYKLLQKRQQAANLEEAMARLMKDRLADRRHRLALAAGRMKGASPLNRLEQGYSYVARQDGGCITSIRDVKEKEDIIISVRDGNILAQVKERAERKWNPQE